MFTFFNIDWKCGKFEMTHNPTKLINQFYWFSSSKQSYSEYDGWLNINLYHALDIAQPDLFVERGNITVSSLSSGSFNVAQEPLSLSDRKQLKALAESGKLYRLKARVTGQNGDQFTFLTSTKAVRTFENPYYTFFIVNIFVCCFLIVCSSKFPII